MRQRTRKGPPPQKNPALQQRMQEMVAKAAKSIEKSKLSSDSMGNLVIDVKALGEADANSQSED